MTSPLLAAVPGLATPNIGGEANVAKEATKEAAGVPFADVLQGAVASANARSNAADAATQAFAAGAVDDIHGTMIAVKQADIELKLVANVRNKLVEAFNDLWRMNI
jgi:flagellar hook-basal body complex protein FliE